LGRTGFVLRYHGISKHPSRSISISTTSPAFKKPAACEMLPHLLECRWLDISPDDVQSYLRKLMRQRALIKTALGYREGRPLKPGTVHQELRVLRRILNVAVGKRLIPSNPCSGVDFPVAIRGLFRAHYVTWSEQQRMERHAPAHLRYVVRIITETGLRVYKELMLVTKEQVDLANSAVRRL
jgi:site-specific recombinase XerC